MYALLNKARKAERPRIDRLATFIPFGTAVQEFCDHLIAAGLRDYLVSPTIVTELVDKLPPPTQLEWVRYKNQQQVVTLQTLSDFLSNIVAEVSEVTMFVEAPSDQSHNRRDRNERKKKEKEYEGFLHTHIGVPEQSQGQSKLTQQSGQQPAKEAASSAKPCAM